MSTRQTNRFWAVLLDLILFLDFLKLFVNMRLGISFARVQIFRPTNQKLWVFENFKRSMGTTGKCWSQLARVDHISPKRWAVGIRRFEESPLRVSSPIF
jgi:hypothetical protein